MSRALRIAAANCILLLICGCTSNLQLVSVEARRSVDSYLLNVSLSNESFEKIHDNESTLWIYLTTCPSSDKKYVYEPYVDGKILNENKWRVTRGMVVTATVPAKVIDSQGMRCAFVDGGNMIGRKFKSSVVKVRII